MSWLLCQCWCTGEGGADPPDSEGGAPALELKLLLEEDGERNEDVDIALQSSCQKVQLKLGVHRVCLTTRIDPSSVCDDCVWNSWGNEH